MEFDFATAERIRFGVGVSAQLGSIAASFGRRALLVTGAEPRRFPAVVDAVAQAGVAITPFAVRGEPTTEAAQEGVRVARDAGCELVIGLGGGSALDAGKAIAALMTNPGEPLDYLEVVGRGRPLSADPAPFIAVPTTAGTGSEVTRNAVLAVADRRVKVSLRSPKMLPNVAVVDPALTLGLPAKETADCGLDALTQVIEPYVSTRANPLTDALCREGIRRAARSLRRACERGDDLEARTDMALTSLFGGLALANAKLGAVHGFAGPIGGMFPAPHGAVCACLLPHVVAANARALASRGGAEGAAVLERYREVAVLLSGRADATVDYGIAWLRTLVEDLGVATLRAYGVDARDLPAIVAKAARSSSMQGNPIVLTEDELRAILVAAL
ncbi:MAG: iron-containing alcohol dehydrogenase [Nannocystaceae bacterium]